MIPFAFVGWVFVVVVVIIVLAVYGFFAMLRR